MIAEATLAMAGALPGTLLPIVPTDLLGNRRIQN
jgi:hypothetical protein